MFEIVEAKRESAPITAAFIGGSGSGKTYSALLFARGLVGPNGVIVVIDSEGGRANIYADDPEIGGFHRIDMVEPYTSKRFKEAFRAAIGHGADAVIIDTASHEHEGFLEFAEAEGNRMGNSGMSSRNKWIKPKGERKRFYSAISSSHAHVILTIRLNRIVNMDVKPAVEIMKPECDKDLPYRMDLSIQINADHTTKVIKVPKPLLGIVEDGVFITKEHGQKLAADSEQQAKPDHSIIETMIRLENEAHAGADALKVAWATEWKKAGPSDDMKKITPARAEMQKHLERLKSLAADVEADGRPEAGEFGDMPDKGQDSGDGSFTTGEGK
tara:strand:+ start:1090 stop:2073 length:984 start_codon:yes stop_codon:yes gene_type:complete